MNPTADIGRWIEVGGIRWYHELRGRGPAVVLIPSGEGDCGSFAAVAERLAADFTVLTFDMPGFSRSGDPPGFAHYSVRQATSEIAALLLALRLGPATVYGCSSGAHFALQLGLAHPALAPRIVVHEAATTEFPLPVSPADDDRQIVGVCRKLFREAMNEDAAAWDALGPEFHQRLDRNYVTWVRRYFPMPDLRLPTAEQLRGLAVTWTIGGLSPAIAVLGNIEAAHAAGIPVRPLMCRHFPQVSIPAVLAGHIAAAARAA